MEAILKFFSSLPREIYVFIISMLPIVELRGAIPIGASLDIPFYLNYLLAIVGNLLPVPFILYFISRFMDFLARFRIFRPMINWIRRKADKHSSKVIKEDKKAVCQQNPDTPSPESTESTLACESKAESAENLLACEADAESDAKSSACDIEAESGAKSSACAADAKSSEKSLPSDAECHESRPSVNISSSDAGAAEISAEASSSTIENSTPLSSSENVNSTEADVTSGAPDGAKPKRKMTRAIFIALILFVAIPIPGTGAWTGSLIAALFNLPKKRSLLAVTVGVLISGVIMTLASYGVIGFLSIFA